MQNSLDSGPFTPAALGPVVVPLKSDQDNVATHVAPAPVKRPAQTNVWGTDFARVDMQQTLKLAEQVIENRRPEYFVTANLNYLMLGEQYPRLQEVNEHAVAVIADGAPIVKRSRLTRAPLPERVAGADMIVELSRLSAEKGYKVFFLGAAPGVAQAAAYALVERFPELEIAGVESPPFRQLNAAEHEAMLKRIRDAKPDILFVAFGQPKGECWIYDNLNDLNVPLSIQLGASFDFLAGTATRAPRFWQRIGCEWLYRAFSDPGRLAPRYASNILFLLKLLARDLRILRA